MTQEVFAEGEQSGEQLKIVNQVIKKVKKSKTLETIASELEEEVADINLDKNISVIKFMCISFDLIRTSPFTTE